MASCNLAGIWMDLGGGWSDSLDPPQEEACRDALVQIGSMIWGNGCHWRFSHTYFPGRKGRTQFLPMQLLWQREPPQSTPPAHSSQDLPMRCPFPPASSKMGLQVCNTVHLLCTCSAMGNSGADLVGTRWCYVFPTNPEAQFSLASNHCGII